ncbi:peptidase M64 [bacterium]|nr:peptidase M64 [bacterium]
MSIKRLLFLLLILCTSVASAQQQFVFDDFFENSTMRIDYCHFGNAEHESISIDHIYKQGEWAGNPKSCIDTFNNGEYYIKVYDVATNKMIYSKGFNSYFGEYITTEPAKKGDKRVYFETALIPWPKSPARFVIEKRGKDYFYYPLFVKKIVPGDYHIIKEKPSENVKIVKTLANGDPHKKVDIAIIAEGYTLNEYGKFAGDVKKYTDLFFTIEPYKNYRKSFNITGVFIPSEESGVDEPTKNIYKSSVFDASFNAFDTPRYLLTENLWKCNDVASAVPHDIFIIMVNSSRYGGGGIYNFYSISTIDNKLSDHVFIHEFGHAFAGLADEYYSSQVAYTDFYPKGTEPQEPNITALLNPKTLKWRQYLSKGIDIPTDWGKTERETLSADMSNIYKDMRHKINEMKKSGADQKKIDEVKDSYKKKIDAKKAQLDKIRKKYSYLNGKVGAFEGAGYSSTGLYRPSMDCLMKSNKGMKFCKVCQKAIERMILYYTR